MRRRISIFLVIVPAILLAATAFVCATWFHFSGTNDSFTVVIAPVLLSLAYAPATLVGFRNSSLGLRIVYAVSATWIGVLNFCFFAAVACWLVDGMAWLMGWPLAPGYLSGILFGAALVVSVYGLINAAWTRVTRITVALPHLPEAWRGRTAALVTDLHLGHLSGPRFSRRIIGLLRRLNPDVVFISGDLFDGTRAGLDHLIAPWRDYTAPRGIYFVTGNHEEIADRRIYLEAVERTGISVLNNEKVTIDGLQLIGVHDAETADPRELRAILQRARIDPRRPSILLAHEPANLTAAELEGISLQLSGHTHHGQFWPWSLLVSRIYGPFAYGLQRLGRLQVYTSSGAGTWGPPLRVGTRSEVVLIRFESRAEGDSL
ncbi:MAG: metallophosphoesterase [Verrucomicrobiota bacterium]